MSVNAPKTAPTGPGERRIQLLDILRGVAIFGTLGTNIWIFSEIGTGGSSLLGGGVPGWSAFDETLASVVALLTNGKFLGLLTILFGVGLEIQFQSARRRGLRWPVRYLWRSALLLVEGFVHYVLIFEFDILMGYAVAAIITAFIVGRSEKVLRRAMWIFGGVHLLFFGLLSGVIVLAILLPGADASLTFSDPEATRVYTSGSWMDQVVYRLDNLLVYRLEPVAIIPMNVFLFLFGARLMRSGVFANDENGRRARSRMLRWGLTMGVPLNLLAIAPDGLFFLPVRYLFAPILAMGYIGVVAWLVDRGALNWIWERCAEVGRMALSCYIGQNIIASIVFYGWGIGLTGKVGAPATLLIAVAICAALMLFANLWLKRFSQGPFEAAWRSLSLLPFRGGKGRN